MRHVGEKLRFVPVGSLDLAALILDLTEQPRVLDRQSRLRSECLKKVNDFRRKATRLLSPYPHSALNPLLAQQRNCQNRSVAMPRGDRPESRGPKFPLLQ